MPKRLVDLYPLRARVEILLGEAQWQPGVVMRHEHPAVWVVTPDGRAWFVTNGRRIRLYTQPEPDEE